MENKKVLLSIKDLHVKFRVRGRTLTAIRGVSLDFYENESVAIVGESGSGKSVLTKTFAGMLDENGYISEGSIVFNDPELSDTVVSLRGNARQMIRTATEKLNQYSKYELGADVHQQIKALETEKRSKSSLSPEEEKKIDDEIKELIGQRTDVFNQKQAVDASKERQRYKNLKNEIASLDGQIKALKKKKADIIAAHKAAYQQDTAYFEQYNKKMTELKAEYAKKTAQEISSETKKRNEIIAKEIYLSIGRYSLNKRIQLM